MLGWVQVSLVSLKRQGRAGHVPVAVEMGADPGNAAACEPGVVYRPLHKELPHPAACLWLRADPEGAAVGSHGSKRRRHAVPCVQTCILRSCEDSCEKTEKQTNKKPTKQTERKSTTNL